MKRKFFIFRTNIKKKDELSSQQAVVKLFNDASDTRHAISFGYNIAAPKELVKQASKNNTREIIFDGPTEDQILVFIKLINKQYLDKYSFYVMRKEVAGATTITTVTDVLMHAWPKVKENREILEAVEA
ncbi:MAG: hypothetical protein ABIO57_01050 [Candidatus Paceibacterota bacterium]